jgi:hypothetical protein
VPAPGEQHRVQKGKLGQQQRIRQVGPGRVQHAERPAHAEEHHDHHGADAGHEAAMAAGTVKHGDQRLPPPGQSLPAVR